MQPRANLLAKKKWEDLSNITLTSVVPSMPKLRPNTDGQSQKTLENCFEKLGQASENLLDAKVENEEGVV